MLCFAVCVVSLASAYDATTHPAPASYRKQRIERAMSTGQAITLRLRGGGTAPPNYRKERMLRAVSRGQAVTLKLRGGESSSPEERLPFADVGGSTSCRQGGASAESGSSAVALVKHDASGPSGACLGAAASSAKSAGADRPTRVGYRKQRILRAMSSGEAVTRRLYC